MKNNKEKKKTIDRKKSIIILLFLVLNIFFNISRLSIIIFMEKTTIINDNKRIVFLSNELNMWKNKN